MINPKQLRELVVRPTLIKILPVNMDAATELLMGTCAQESDGGTYIAQLGGPALGIWQMEPFTHDDIWKSFLTPKPTLRDKIDSLIGSLPYEGDKFPLATNMIGNLYYACAMARMLYYRVPAPLPAQGDYAAQARYYKQYYNTPAGAATVEQYLGNWNRMQQLLG